MGIQLFLRATFSTLLFCSPIIPVLQAHADVTPFPSETGLSQYGQARSTSADGRLIFHPGGKTVGGVFYPILRVSVFRPEVLTPRSGSGAAEDARFLKNGFYGGTFNDGTEQPKKFYEALHDVRSLGELLAHIPSGRGSDGQPFSKVHGIEKFLVPPQEGQDLGINTMAVVPDPSDVENPQKFKDASGALLERYTVLIFSTSSEPVEGNDCQERNSSRFGVGVFKVEVIVKNPRTPSADVSSAQILSNWQPLLLSNGKKLCARHPSVTFDGRLMVFEDGSYISYTWNNEPDTDPEWYVRGWSAPQDITKMHYLEKDKMVFVADGAPPIKFSQRYSIAREPMKDGLGRPYRDSQGNPLWTNGESLTSREALLVGFAEVQNKVIVSRLDRHMYLGGYPWITPDGTDLICATAYAWRPTDVPGLNPLVPANDSDGAVRAAEASIGYHSKFAQRHLDSGINQNRSTRPLLQSIRQKLVADYPNATGTAKSFAVKDLLAFAVQRYSRNILSSPGPQPSMWGPYREVPRIQIPFQKSSAIIPVFTNSGQYHEINYDDSNDGSYLLFMHMQEALSRVVGVGVSTAPVELTDHTSIVEASAVKKSRGLTARYQTGYLADRTPDSSGVTSSSGTLSYGELADGARFPLEQNGRDETVGAIGQAIYFPEKGYVRVVNDQQLNNLGKRNRFTVEFFYKFLVDRLEADTAQPQNKRYLVRKPNVFEVTLESNGAIQAKVFLKNSAKNSIVEVQTGVINTPAIGQGGKAPWVHVSASFNARVDASGNKSGVLTVFIDGKSVFSKTVEYGIIADGAANLEIGPHYGNASGPAILLMDEVSVSDIVRSPADREKAAMVKSESRPIATTQALELLPLGLNLADYVQAPTVANPTTIQNRIRLGEVIFNDKRFSKNGQISCATCHDASRGFTDGKRVSEGVAIGQRNTPTIINRALASVHLFDGRAGSIEAQVRLPFTNPDEMGLTSIAQDVVPVMKADANYRTLAKNASLDVEKDWTAPVALAAFIRSLNKANSKVDAYEAGNLSALSEQEKKGRALFHGKARCVSCHSNSNFSDEKFHKTGLSLNDDKQSDESRRDYGRSKITGLRLDDFAFKTPTLRDISKTAPYLHDGSVNTLREVVEKYNEGAPANIEVDAEIMPLGLTSTEVDNLVKFLEALDSDSAPR